MKHPFRFGFLTLLFFLLLFVCVLSLRLGVVSFSWSEVFSTLAGGSAEPLAEPILMGIRLPRILLGALAGSAFAVSGAILQGILRNPLASPGILGISSGGGLTGVLILILFPEFAGKLLGPATFAGSFAAALTVYLLAWKKGIEPVRLILSGVAVSAMLGALTSAVMLCFPDQAGRVLDFTVGSLAMRSWNDFPPVLPGIAIGFTAAFFLSGELNILELGDDAAADLGVSVEKVRLGLLATASLLAASGVGAAGLLGFAGLIAPHIVRRILGADNRYVIPGSALFGALLVVVCDTCGRLIRPPSELPAGLLLALLGPPFFLWLLRRESHAH